MKFVLNDFPDDAAFQPDEAWTPLKESDNMWMVQLQAVPFMIINVAFVVVLMRLIGISFSLNSISMLLSFLIFIPVHEVIHALFFPGNLKSDNVYFGFILKSFAFFAAYLGEMKRNSFISVLLAPFIIITMAGLLYLYLAGSNSLVEHIVVFNALGACADCLGVYLVLKQVPRHAMVRNKKIRTYWRLADSAA